MTASLMARFSSGLPMASEEERWVFAVIASTFVFYFMGALYLMAPILGWILIARLIFVGLLSTPSKTQPGFFGWLWIAAALGLLMALVIGHVSFDLGLGKIIKSTIGWAKGWALLSVFILVGLISTIRAEFIIRAACLVGLFALILTPVLVMAWVLDLPGYLYVSPLKVLGGSGPEYFTVILYEIDPGNGSPRWRFFAPWAPAVGFVANIYLLCAFFEKARFWKIAGLCGNALMILLAASRMGILVMVIVPTAVLFLSRLTRPYVLLSAFFLILLVALNFEMLYDWVTGSFQQIKEARADSTRVRATLNDIAVYRWHTEAFWFGHGVVEAGSHLVEFMPIGTHHNWFGLLFVKGVIGLSSFMLPFVLTGLALLLRAQVDQMARLPLGAFMVLSFFSLSENIEALAYLTWPAWLLIGIALRSPLSQFPWAEVLVPRSHIQRELSYETR